MSRKYRAGIITLALVMTIGMLGAFSAGCEDDAPPPPPTQQWETEGDQPQQSDVPDDYGQQEDLSDWLD